MHSNETNLLDKNNNNNIKGRLEVRNLDEYGNYLSLTERLQLNLL